MIWQTTVWTCDNCGYKVARKEEVYPYSGIVVEPPDYSEWEYIGDPEKLSCHRCL